MTEKRFYEDMAFLHKAYAFGKRGLESNLHKIQTSNLEVERDKLTNTKVYLEDMAYCSNYMLDAEKRMIEVYREFHKLNGKA